MKLKTVNKSLLLPVLASFLLSGCSDDEPTIDHQISAQMQKEVFERLSGT